MTPGFLDQVTDWQTGDSLTFGGATGTITNYLESSATDYAAAQTFANAQINGGVVDYVAVQVGTSVVVFADSGNNNGTAEDAVVLVGRTLADIDFGNFT